MPDQTRSSRFARLIWNDPVWSKVIATMITAATGALIYSAWEGIRPRLSILSLSIIWASLLYARIAKNSVIVFESTVKRHVFPRRIRRLALCGLILIPLVAGVSSYLRYVAPKKTIVLICQFNGEAPKKYRVTETIIDQLELASRSYHDIELRQTPDSLDVKDSTAARLQAAKYGASVVIWGWYATTEQRTRISAHFELIDVSPLIFIHSADETITSAVGALDSFELQGTLSTQVSQIALLAAALVSLERSDTTGALDRLNAIPTEETAQPKAFLNPIVHYWRAFANRELGHDEQAFEESTKAITADPSLGLAYILRGGLYSERGEWDSALSDFNKGMELWPQYPWAFFGRGLVYKNVGQLGRAIQDYSRAIELAPGFAEFYTNRGNAYLAQNDFEKALHDYDQAISIDANLGSAYVGRANVYARRDLTRALADANTGVRLLKHNAQALNTRGYVYDELGQKEKALSDFNQAIEVNPNLALSYENRGKWHMKEGNFEQAIQDLTTALSKGSSDTELYSIRAWSYLQTGKPDLALRDYERAIIVTPLKTELLLAKANVYWIMNNKGKAAVDFKKVLRITDDIKAREIAEESLAQLRVRQCLGSGHDDGSAVDIEAFGGRSVGTYWNDPKVREEADWTQMELNRQGALENFGPSGLYRKGQRFFDMELLKNHSDHIHASFSR